MGDLHAQLLAATGPLIAGTVLNTANLNGPRAALRAVVELHEPLGFLRRPLTHPICEACSPGDGINDERWPCSTIRVIADALGVAVGDQVLIEKESPTNG